MLNVERNLHLAVYTIKIISTKKITPANRHRGAQSHVRSEGASGKGCDIVLIDDRMADMGNPGTLVSRTHSESHLYDKTTFHVAVHIQGKKYAGGVLPSLDLENPSMIEMLMNSKLFTT